MTPGSTPRRLCERRWWSVRSENECDRHRSRATSRGRKGRRTQETFDRSIIGPTQQATEESALRLLWFGITVRRSRGWSRFVRWRRLRLTHRLDIDWYLPFFRGHFFLWRNLLRRLSNLRRFQFCQLLLDELGRFVRHCNRARREQIGLSLRHLGPLHKWQKTPGD